MAIFTAIGGAIAGALGLGGATLFGASAASLIGGGLALAAQVALSYINRPKKTVSTAVQGQVQLGGNVPAQVLFGTGKTKGHRIYYAKWGQGNQNNDDVFVLANGRCDGLEPYVYFYGEKHDLVSQTPVGNEHARYTVDGFGAAMVIKFYDGRPGQLADSELVSVTSGLGNPWQSTSTVAGHAYVVVSRTWSADLFGKGVPEIEFVLRGWRMYDPRLDDTVSGGEGDHRLNDPDTWEFTKNPAIHRLNFQLGLRGLSSGDVLVGVGKSISQIDVAMHMAAANVCDTERTVGERTIATYHNNLFVSAEDDHIAVLQMMEDAMAGYAVNRAGLDGVLAGAAQVPVLTITEADIRPDAPRKSQNRRSGFDSINILSGQFTSIENNWNPESLTTVSVNADIAADGRKRPAGNDFLQVTDPDIAQYLLNIRYRQNRKARRRSLPVSRKVGTRIQPGDWVTYESTDWLVTKWGFDESFRFMVELSETGDDVYDEEGIEAGPVVVAPSSPANPSLVSTVANFDVTAGLIEGVNGAQVPALEFTWDDPEDPTITSVRVFYRKAGTSSPVLEATATDVASGSLIITQGIQSGTSYEARATITTRPDRLKSFTDWETTAAATASLKVILGEVGADVAGTLAGMRADFNDLRAQVTSLGDTVSGMGLSNRQTIGRVQSRVGAAQAAVNSEIITRADEYSSLASSLTVVNADFNDRFASGLMKFEARAAPDGVDARFSVMLRAGVGDDFKEAGFYLDLRTVESVQRSEFAILADRFAVTDGDTTAYPLYFDGSTLYADGLKVQWADIEDVEITSAQIADATITSAKIADLTIETSNITLASITAQDSVSGSNVPAVTGVWTTVCTVTIDNPSERFVFINYAISQGGGRISGGGAVTVLTRFRRVEGGVTFAQIGGTLPTGAAGSVASSTSAFIIDDNTGATEVTYVVEVYQDAALNQPAVTASGSIKLLWGLR
ncbi:phage tail tip fiber protein [Hoeflea sp.]|uniref:phage tail tip fiber protein n=1 Tax=Hoeflea sp. TaxID=1940281 RepID=UPI003B5181EA